jgi:hypothetical protein
MLKQFQKINKFENMPNICKTGRKKKRKSLRKKKKTARNEVLRDNTGPTHLKKKENGVCLKGCAAWEGTPAVSSV